MKKLQCWQFEDSGSDETEPRGSKCQQLDTRNNEEEESLDRFEDEDEKKNKGYVSLLFITNLLP